MQPITPIIIALFLFFIAFNASNLFHIFSSAFSRMEHVLRNTASASSIFSVGSNPAIRIIEAMTSLSATFIWQPYVSMNSFLILSSDIIFLICGCKVTYFHLLFLIKKKNKSVLLHTEKK